MRAHALAPRRRDQPEEEQLLGVRVEQCRDNDSFQISVRAPIIIRDMRGSDAGHNSERTVVPQLKRRHRVRRFILAIVLLAIGMMSWYIVDREICGGGIWGDSTSDCYRGFSCTAIELRSPSGRC